MEWYIVALIICSILIIVLASGMPVPFALGIVGLLGILFIYGCGETKIVALILWHWGTIFAIICLPLFVFMAEFLIYAGAADSLFDAAQKWLDWVPGSLAVSSVFSCGIFAAIVGGSTVNAAAIGTVAVPQMRKRGYDTRLATGCVAAGGTLGILIPPSSTMILYAILTDQSIGQLFMGGIIPGIMMVLLFSLYIVFMAVRYPKMAPSVGSSSFKEKVVALKGVWPTIVIILLVLGTIYGGIATASESAALGALGAAIIALFFRKSNWEVVKGALMRTMRITGFVGVLVMGAMVFGFLITRLGIPQNLVAWINSMEFSPIAILVVINIMYLVLGCFIDPAAMIALTVPVIFPIMVNAGYDPVWFGVMLVMNMEMGNITPPVGLNLYILKSISPPDVKLSDILVGALPFVIMLGIGIVLVVLFPDLILYIPTHMMTVGQ